MLIVVENGYLHPLVVIHDPILAEHQSMAQVKDSSTNPHSNAIHRLKGHRECPLCDISVAGVVVVVVCHVVKGRCMVHGGEKESENGSKSTCSE